MDKPLVRRGNLCYTFTGNGEPGDDVPNESC